MAVLPLFVMLLLSAMLLQPVLLLLVSSHSVAARLLVAVLVDDVGACWRLTAVAVSMLPTALHYTTHHPLTTSRDVYGSACS